MKRSLALLVVVFAVAVPAYPFGQNKIVYDKFHWNIYHSTHFDVYFYDEERPSLEKVVDMAESAYDTLSREFNYQIAKKIPLIYYATHSAFEQTNVDLNFIPEGVGAFAEPTRNRMVIPIDTTDEFLLHLVQHELTHVFEYEILFQGKLGKSVTANPPTWFMEGLASFMGDDENDKDRMVLRDAVVTDLIPKISKAYFGGYFAYRFGHAVFKYIQETYGWDGLRDFIYEYRNTLGNSVDKALKRAFNVTPDEFDTQFRTWLRRQYLPALVTKGEPQEYGERFRVGPNTESDEISPVPSPSGDLLASFTTYKENIDVALFNIPQRRLLRGITGGFPTKYEYPIVQMMTVGPVMGRDIAFAPSGDAIAFFAKKERGRNLIIMNALDGRIERSIPMKIDQQLNPAYSPDGTKIAFAGILNNQSDIFLYDLDSGKITNLTGDKYYDGSPVFSPDGKWIVYSSDINGYYKLVKMNVAKPAERYQLTSGSWNDEDAWFSPDGTRIFFSSDKQTGRNNIVEAAKILQSTEPAGKESKPPDPKNFAAYNIYSLNLENGNLLQYTDVIGGCFTPIVFIGKNNKEELVFASYYKRQWQLYSTMTDKPLHAPEKTIISNTPLLASDRHAFEPPVEVTIDADKVEKPRGFKLFVDDVSVNAGVTSDQLLVSQSTIYMSDMLGNRRFIASFDSVSSFSTFDLLYFDMQHRTNWGVRAFDQREFYITAVNATGSLFSRHQLYRESGAMGLVSYPFDRYHRLDGGVGFESRSFSIPYTDSSGNVFLQDYADKFPIASATFSGDTTVFREFGPISGHRYEISTAIAPDIKRGGVLSNDYTLDARNYLQITSRSLLATRLFVAYSKGNVPNFYYFGGLNTIRGYDFDSILGNQAAYANVELRFPLIDVLATPFLAFEDIRGNLFLDVGAAKFNNQPCTLMTNGRLARLGIDPNACGAASVGYGLSFDFLGLELHFDFAKRMDLRHTYGNVRSEFWIGETF